MVRDICNILKDKIATQQHAFLNPDGTASTDYVGKLAGLVKTLQMTEYDGKNAKIVKRFPVSYDITLNECQTTGKYKYLVPDENKTSIIYFEEIGSPTPPVRHANILSRTVDIRLVCWLNLLKMSGNEELTGQIQAHLLNSFPSQPFNNSAYNYRTIYVQYLGDEVKDDRIFNRYTYNEAETQYLMYPYDFFASKFRVSYEVNLDCLDDLSFAELDCLPT